MKSIAVIGLGQFGRQVAISMTQKGFEVLAIDTNEESVVEMTVWLGLIPVFWRAKHLDVHPVSGFSDIQEAGPFQRWKHQHKFQKLDENKSLIVDQIEAEFKTGWRGIVGRLIWLGLPSLFVYRHWRTKKLLLQSSKKMTSISQYITR